MSGRKHRERSRGWSRRPEGLGHWPSELARASGPSWSFGDWQERRGLMRGTAYGWGSGGIGSAVDSLESMVLGVL